MAAALAAGGAARAPHLPVERDPRWTALRRDVPGLLARHGVPSVSIARVEGRRVVSAEVILRLASAGRLGLDEPMAPTWLDPDLAADPRHARLTARLALSHQTGLPNWRREAGGALRFLRDPGEGFRYSGEGYEYAALCPAGGEAGCQDEAGFGLGWEVYRFAGETCLMHTGKDPGVFAIATPNPGAGSGTVILTSGEDGALLVLPVLERIGADRPLVAFLRRLAGG